MGTPNYIQKKLPLQSIKAQIELVWLDLANSPKQQALVCSELCLEKAPQLADWLKGKILAQITDRELLQLIKPPTIDERILALNRLCEYSAPPAPPRPASPKINQIDRSEAKRAGRSKSQLTDFQANYQIIYGVIPETLPEVPSEIRVEPELGRASIFLHVAAEFRVYVIAREITRSGDGSGRTTKKALKKWMKAYGQDYSREHLSRLLRAGEGLFWNRSYKDIYIRNPAHVAASMAEIDPSVFTTNKPGVRDMYLSPTGSLEQWEAMLYAAWLAYRENPTIARETLAHLFNRSADTLRLWEEKHLSGLVTVRANYAQCPHPNLEDDRYFEHIPEHSQAYRGYVQFQGKWTEVIRFYWRTCNTYQVKGIRQHHRKGQAPQVRKRINDVLDQPASERRSGLLRFKRYFDTPEGLRKHVRKHGGVYYLWRGESRKGKGIFEINNTGFGVTYPNEYHATLFA